ncbi:MAG: NfeD family protein [Bacteroidales bacterium]
MRRISLLLALFIASMAAAQSPTIFVLEIKEEINNSSLRKFSKGVERALKLEVDYLMLHLNTYGGAVDAADSIRTKLLNLKIPTAVYIDNQAVSAGALISIACDSIYMKGGGTIGAATVVDQTGTPAPDKYQSFMRAVMRSTAQVQGRDPNIAEAMVDPTISIKGLIDSTKVLSFTASEAIEHNYCEAEADSLEEALQLFTASTNFNIEREKITLLDRVILALLLPFVQGILLMVIVGGIYFELQSPGIGFPSLAAVTAAFLYFAPLYLEGIAQYWEILLFALGVILLLIEIFVIPGFGITGISGIILIILGLSFAMVENDLFYRYGSFNFAVLVRPVSIVVTALFFSLAGSLYLAGKFLPKRSFSKISLQTVLSNQEGFVSSSEGLEGVVGERAVVKSAMRPSGKVEIGGRWYDAIMVRGMAELGDIVEVIKVEGGRLHCQYPSQ